jgi:protein-L-isoaspartate(D-aspartate) O-methyltransferase
MLTMLAYVALMAGAWAATDYTAKRRAMVEEIEKMAALTADETGRAKLDPRVLSAMANVPRHEFVPRKQADPSPLLSP